MNRSSNLNASRVCLQPLSDGNISIAVEMSTKTINKFDQYIKQISRLFDLLAEKNRLGIFAILTYGEFTVTDIYKCLELRQNLISHHLLVLKENGLVKSRKSGRRVFYSLNNSSLKTLQEVLSKIFPHLPS